MLLSVWLFSFTKYLKFFQNSICKSSTVDSGEHFQSSSEHKPDCKLPEPCCESEDKISSLHLCKCEIDNDSLT